MTCLLFITIAVQFVPPPFFWRAESTEWTELRLLLKRLQLQRSIMEIPGTELAARDFCCWFVSRDTGNHGAMTKSESDDMITYSRCNGATVQRVTLEHQKEP